jgi:hypothetical protein
VSGGLGIAVGVRESPIHLSRDTYLDKMRWVSGQHSILWDEGDKRGWLVNGASALLHLVCASLEDDLKWIQKHANSNILFKKDDMMGPTISHTPDSALNVLMNRTNKELKIFVNEVEGDDEGIKTTCTRFKHLVEKQYSLLEQIMDHQFHIEDRSGLDLKWRTREHLEGWDFRDLAVTIKTTPIYPRLKKLPKIGRGWVDFTREIKAITIFGKSFGEIIRPTGAASMCGSWAQVPAEKYYLTACVSDLKAVMGLKDDQHDCKNPISICDGLNWHASENLFKKCQCGQMTGNNVKHSDVAQVLAPLNTAFRRAPTTSGTFELKHTGAVIFGYNTIRRLCWPDQGNPEEGDTLTGMSVETPEEENDFHDSAIGTSPALMTTDGSETQSSTLPDRAAAAPSTDVGAPDAEAPGPSRNQESPQQTDMPVPSSRHSPSETPGHAIDHTVGDSVGGRVSRRSAGGRLKLFFTKAELAGRRLIRRARFAGKPS